MTSGSSGPVGRGRVGGGRRTGKHREGPKEPCGLVQYLISAGPQSGPEPCVPDSRADPSQHTPGEPLARTAAPARAPGGSRAGSRAGEVVRSEPTLRERQGPGHPTEVRGGRRVRRGAGGRGQGVRKGAWPGTHRRPKHQPYAGQQARAGPAARAALARAPRVVRAARLRYYVTRKTSSIRPSPNRPHKWCARGEPTEGPKEPGE